MSVAIGDTIQGVVSHPSLESLRPIFKKWNELIDAYTETVPEDVPFGVGRERSVVGILHAAALMNEPWQGLQEFSQLKATRGGRSMGRPDLWLFNRSGPNGEPESFYFEAKVTYITVGASAEEREQWARDCLEKAKEDATRVRAYKKESPRFIALALINYKGSETSVSEIEAFAEQAQGYVGDRGDPRRIVSWVFPAEARRKNSGYVGIVALAEEVESCGERI